VQPTIRRTDGSTWTLDPLNRSRALITAGARVEVPANSGQWYTVRIAEDSNLDGVLDSEDTNGNFLLDGNEDDGGGSAPPDDQDGFLDSEDLPADFADRTSVSGAIEYREDVLILTSHYVDSFWNPAATTSGSAFGDFAPVTELVPYRLELAPTVLPNSEPVQLSQGIVIDLDASRLPDQWRPSPPTGAYAESFDILFDARGTPTGPIVASGLIHLYLTTTSDVELTRGRDPNHPRNATGGGPFNNWPYVPAAPPVVPVTDPIVLSLFTQGGQVTTANINPANTGPDDWADTPFSFARRGQEAQ
jgi:hypothetical protein